MGIRRHPQRAGRWPSQKNILRAMAYVNQQARHRKAVTLREVGAQVADVMEVAR